MSDQELLSDRTRLLIMATLAAHPEGLDFNGLLNSLSLTRGNLSSHMRRLEEANLVEVKKEFVGRKPLTSYAATPAGSAAVKDYLEEMERLLSAIKPGGGSTR